MTTPRPLSPTQITALQWLVRGELVFRHGAWRPRANLGVRLPRRAVERLLVLEFARASRVAGERVATLTHTGGVVAAAYSARRISA